MCGLFILHTNPLLFIDYLRIGEIKWLILLEEPIVMIYLRD